MPSVTWSPYFIPGNGGEDYSGYMAAMLAKISKTTGIQFEFVLEEDVTLKTLFRRLLGRDSGCDAFIMPLTYGIPSEFKHMVAVGGPIYTGTGTIVTRRTRVPQDLWVNITHNYAHRSSGSKALGRTLRGPTHN